MNPYLSINNAQESIIVGADAAQESSLFQVGDQHKS